MTLITIYEDKDMAVTIPERPATAGHVEIIPKEKLTILEQAPDELLGKMWVVANKLSAILFETFQAHGTNIIIQNGVPAGQKLPVTTLHVIPRTENDGLDLDWTPVQAKPEELDEVQRSLEPFIQDLSSPQPVAKPKKAPDKTTMAYDKDNYLFKQLDRIP